MATLIRSLPVVYVIAAPLFFLIAYLLSGPHPTATALSTYPLYAMAATAMWAFFLLLILNSGDGKASVLLVTVFYEAFFFAVTLWAISLIAPLVILDYDAPALARLTRSFVAMGAGATVVTVVAVYGAWRRGLLEKRIWPWPVPPRKVG